MKFKIISFAAIAAILLTGCSLLSDGEAPLPGTIGDTPKTNAAVSENTVSEPSVTEEVVQDELPVTAESTETEPAETTAQSTEKPKETEAETTAASEEEPPAAQVTEGTDAPAESEDKDIGPDYMYQNEDDFFYIVNKQQLLPEDYDIKLDYVQGDYKMEVTAAKYMREMIAAAEEDGIELKILSTYRTVKYQKNLFERNVKSRMEDYGMTYEEAYYDTSINIAPPGGSEHNAGLAADIITKNDWDTYEGFEDTDEFAWLQEHAWEYGYILRYLKGKEDITGYIYEPWHYRYVGVKYAKTVRDSGLCLEEYFEQYVWADGSEPVFPWDESLG